MKTKILSGVVLGLLLLVVAACVPITPLAPDVSSETAETPAPAEENVQAGAAMAVSIEGLTGQVGRGGQLYDEWWVVTGADAPADDHPLWAQQSNNTRSGADTWRCKECHGWDYLGNEGAYASGSHMTGFPGVLSAQSKSDDELVAALTGGTNADHDFSAMLDPQALADIVAFIHEGPVDDRDYIDYTTKTPLNADIDYGMVWFENICSECHGPEGTDLNFGSAEEPEYIGTIATENPQEFLHKAHFGQPGSDPEMPITFEDYGWSIEDVVNILSYAQTLPTGSE